MYTHSNIISCLRGLVGFDNSYSTSFDPVDADLQASTSGIRIGPSLHPLFTAENIYAIAELFAKVTVRTWSGSGIYLKGDVVKEGSDIYQSIQDANVNHQPSLSTAYWVKTNLYSAYLRRMYDASAAKLVGAIFTDKKVNEASKSILSNVNLYEGVGNMAGRINKQNRVVGFRISLKHPDTIAMLNYVGLQVDTPQNPLNLYLYHSSQNSPVKTITLNQTMSISFKWHKITSEILSFMSDSTNAAGNWYLCYYESELTGQAINKTVSFDGKYCGHCSEGATNLRLHNEWSKVVSIQPFYITSPYVNIDKTIWDTDKEIYVADWNFGLNMQLSVQCDVSNWICQNRNIITDALTQQLKVDFLNEMAYSLRDNQKRERVAALAATALDNQDNGQYGEAKKLIKAIEAMSFDFSGINRMCLPCSNKQSRLSSVWRG